MIGEQETTAPPFILQAYLCAVCSKPVATGSGCLPGIRNVFPDHNQSFADPENILGKPRHYDLQNRYPCPVRHSPSYHNLIPCPFPSAAKRYVVPVYKRTPPRTCFHPEEIVIAWVTGFEAVIAVFIGIQVTPGYTGGYLVDRIRHNDSAGRQVTHAVAIALHPKKFRLVL